jgi:tRNA(Arg) A34 adenosine deaminase TadA
MSSGSWMREALELARAAAAMDEVPVGAVVVHAGPEGERVVGRGHNRRETDQSPVAHAEVLALAEAARALGSWRLTGCRLFVTLEPCPMCLGAAQQARVDGVEYGAADPKGGALSLGYRLHEDARTNHRFPVAHAPDEECGAVLREFFAGKRR